MSSAKRPFLACRDPNPGFGFLQHIMVVVVRAQAPALACCLDQTLGTLWLIHDAVLKNGIVYGIV